MSLQTSGRKVSTSLGGASGQRSGLRKPTARKQTAKARAAAISLSDSDDAADATSPAPKRRQSREDGPSQSADLGLDLDKDGMLDEEAYKKRKLSIAAASLAEQKQQTTLLKEIVKGQADIVFSFGGGKAEKGANLQTGKDALAVAWEIAASESFYPSPSILDEYTAKAYGCASYAEAKKECGGQEVASFRKTVSTTPTIGPNDLNEKRKIKKVSAKLCKPIRSESSAEIKKLLIPAYREVYTISVEQEDGSYTVKWGKLQKLVRDGSSRYRTGNNGPDSDTPTFGCPAFRTILANGFKGKPEDWDPSQPITWLGMGHIAFCETLVIWLLSGHTAIPNVTNDPRHAEWDDLHSSILEAVAERGDTVEVTFWKPQSKAAPPAAGVGTPAVTNVDD